MHENKVFSNYIVLQVGKDSIYVICPKCFNRVYNFKTQLKEFEKHDLYFGTCNHCKSNIMFYHDGNGNTNKRQGSRVCHITDNNTFINGYYKGFVNPNLFTQ